MSGLREALEKTLGSLPVMTYDTAPRTGYGYRTQALPKAQLLDLLAAYPVEPAPVATICPECTERQVRLSSTHTGLFTCAACGRQWLFKEAPVADRKHIAANVLGPAICMPDWSLLDLADALLAAGVFRSEAEVKAEALEEEAARTYRDGGYDYPFAASEIAAFLKTRAAALRAGEPS